MLIIQFKIKWAIRSLAEVVIIEVIPFAGPSALKKIVSDLKPVIQNTVKPQIEKCLSKSNVYEQEDDDAPVVPVKPEQTAKSKPNKSNEASMKGKRPGTAAPMTAKKIFDKLPKYQAGVGLPVKGAPEEDKFVILDVGK